MVLIKRGLVVRLCRSIAVTATFTAVDRRDPVDLFSQVRGTLTR
jgi:hypothetical protein